MPRASSSRSTTVSMRNIVNAKVNADLLIGTRVCFPFAILVANRNPSARPIDAAVDRRKNVGALGPIY